MKHRVVKGFQHRSSGNWFTLWKANFNMIVPDTVWDWSGSYLIDKGYWEYSGESTSFNLTGFYPGWEICAFFSFWYWENYTPGSAQLFSSWRRPDNSTMFQCANNITYDLPVGYYWCMYIQACCTGICPWEVASDGVYKVVSRAQGSGGRDIPEKITGISFNNVPDSTQMDTSKAGYMWVEGNTLCYINSYRWKHVIWGELLNFVGTQYAGKFWISREDYSRLYWIGSSGYKYRVKWRREQERSMWSPGPSSWECPGSSYEGKIWVDAQWGHTHLAYIGSQGCKIITGSGNDPYVSPY